MEVRNLRVVWLAIIAATVLAGCQSEATESAGQVSAEGPSNTAPTIGGNPSATATVGSSWQFQPSARDSDDDVLTFTATGLPGWLSLNAQTGLVSGMPTIGDVGATPAIRISVADGERSASLTAFSINVAAPATAAAPTAEPPAHTEPPPPTEPLPTPLPPPPPANAAPIISGSPASSVQATTAYAFTPAATDVETPSLLTFSIANKPIWASFSVATGALAGTPAAGQAGTYAGIFISVSDGSLSASLPAFSITVTAAPNRAPTISGAPAASVTAGAAYSFRPTSSDPDGQPLSFSIVNKPAWANFSTSTGRLTGTPQDAHVGTTSGIVISVSDGTLSASLAPFNLRVDARPNESPQIAGTPQTSVDVGSAYRFAPTASDPDGDALTWSIAGKPGPAVFSTVTGELTWTPSAAGIWQGIAITVTDSRGASASLPAFTITVAPVVPTGSAALSWTAPAQYTDGSPMPIGELDAYRIYHGTSAASLARVAEVDSGTTTFNVSQLTAGTHYFAVTAVSITGIESNPSEVGSKTIQ